MNPPLKKSETQWGRTLIRSNAPKCHKYRKHSIPVTHCEISITAPPMKHPLWLAILFPLVISATGHAGVRSMTIIECMGRADPGMGQIRIHWDDGMEGSMTVEELRSDGTLVGFYRQSAVSLDSSTWRIDLPYDNRGLENRTGRYLEQLGEHPIQMHNQNHRLIGFCRVID